MLSLALKRLHAIVCEMKNHVDTGWLSCTSPWAWQGKDKKGLACSLFHSRSRPESGAWITCAWTLALRQGDTRDGGRLGGASPWFGETLVVGHRWPSTSGVRPQQRRDSSVIVVRKAGAHRFPEVSCRAFHPITLIVRSAMWHVELACRRWRPPNRESCLDACSRLRREPEREI